MIYDEHFQRALATLTTEQVSAQLQQMEQVCDHLAERIFVINSQMDNGLGSSPSQEVMTRYLEQLTSRLDEATKIRGALFKSLEKKMGDLRHMMLVERSLADLGIE